MYQYDNTFFFFFFLYINKNTLKKIGSYTIVGSLFPIATNGIWVLHL